jgi:hypothetical protein
MSSSGEAERFTIGAHVDATDGRCGRLTRVILDPGDESLTHLVVEPGHHKELERLAAGRPRRSVEDDLIRLDCTKKRFEQPDAAEDIRFLPADSTPTYAAINLPLGHHRGPMFTDRVPPGEIDIRRGDPVHATDGSIAGLHQVIVYAPGTKPEDVNATLTRPTTGVPAGVPLINDTTNRVGDEIRVDLTKEEIEELPPVSIR